MEKADFHSFTMSIPVKTFRGIKVFCAKEGLTLKTFCWEALENHLSLKDPSIVKDSTLLKKDE